MSGVAVRVLCKSQPLFMCRAVQQLGSTSGADGQAYPGFGEQDLSLILSMSASSEAN